MLYYTSKVLQEFLYPFNIALLLLTASQWWYWRGKLRRAAIGSGSATTLLIVAGLPFVGDWSIAALESATTSRPVEDYPEAGAIVVLGGTTPATRPPRLEPEEVGGSRLLQAARLYRAGKAPRIVVSGGVGYETTDGQLRTEADDMRDILSAMQVPVSDILCEAASRTTYENAVLTAPLLSRLQARSILLVTSATHMRRAEALFRAQGFEVTAVPTGFHASPGNRGLRCLLPTPGDLVRTSLAIKELCGFAAYRLLGQL